MNKFYIFREETSSKTLQLKKMLEENVNMKKLNNELVLALLIKQVLLLI